jgi:hypothetical protein
VSKETYKELMMQNVIKEYNKCDDKVLEKVNKEYEDIADNLELDDRIDAFSKRDAFLTVKDHKANFMNNTKCRLINPAKSDLGKVSKSILSRIMTSLRERTKLNQWKNSFSVIDWFKKLNDKETLSFLVFDILEFYPNITEDLLKKSFGVCQEPCKHQPRRSENNTPNQKSFSLC